MNNFDASSNGVNLNLSVSFDLCRSQGQFSENFCNISDSGGSLINKHYFDVNIWLFTAYGEYTKDFKLEDTENYNLKSGTVKQIKQWYNDNISNYTIDQNDASMNYFDKYFSQLTKSELIELIENETYTQYFIEFLTNTFDPLFEVLAIRGYSQGEYAEIIFTNELMKEYNFDDKEKFLSMMQDYFTNLFYDAPLYARLDVDDQEYYFDDFQENSYCYDKNEILEHAKKVIEHNKKDYIINWLSENLPDQPDYH